MGISKQSKTIMAIWAGLTSSVVVSLGVFVVSSVEVCVCTYVSCSGFFVKTKFSGKGT